MDKNILELKRDISKLMIHAREYHNMYPKRDMNKYFQKKLSLLLSYYINNQKFNATPKAIHQYQHIQKDTALLKENRRDLNSIINAIYNRPYHQRNILLKLARNISKCNNPKLEHYLINNLVELYVDLEKHNNTDKLYPDAVAKDVKNMIAQSGLNKDIQTLLSNIIIDKQNDKSDDRGQQILRVCSYVKSQISLLTSLKSVQDVSELSKYALSVIVHKQKNHSLLMLGGLATDTKLDGERMLDFIANEKETALEYTYNAQQRMNNILNTKKLKIAKQEVPFIFGDKMERLMGFFKLLIENSSLPLNMLKELKNPLHISKINEFYLISDINSIFNKYLLHLKLLTLKNHHFTLTKIGKSIILDTKNYNNNIRRFLSINDIYYQNNQLWTKFFKFIIKSLRWTYKHPSYHNFYGLAFALNVLSTRAFKMIINFKHKGQTYSLNAKPITYFAIIFPLIHTLFVNPTQKIVPYHSDMKLIKKLHLVDYNIYEYSPIFIK